MIDRVRVVLRTLVASALATALIATGLPLAHAEPYPARPIKIVVAYASGGQADAIARAFAQRLNEKWNMQAIIVNQGGAAGTIGAEAVSKAAADGYTLLFGGSSNLALAPVLNAVGYDPSKDFAAIGAVARAAYALAVNASVPVHTVPELVDYARANPGRLNYGSTGTGSASALGAQLLMAATGIELVQIPYKGTAPAITDLLAGHVDLMFADLAQLTQHAKTGALRLLANAGETRSLVAPDLPTVAEQGIPAVAIDAWYGLLAPAHTPPEIVAQLSTALNEIVAEQDFRQHLQALGYDPIDNRAQGLSVRIESDIRKFAELKKRMGVKAVE